MTKQQQHSDTNHIFLRSFFAHLSFCVVICFSCFFTQAQSFIVVRSSVGHHLGSNLTASTGMYRSQHVVGQSIASTIINAGSYAVIQGFIQPLNPEESFHNFTDDRLLDIELITYPNPVIKTLFIDLNQNTNKPIRVLISDLYGRTILQQKFTRANDNEIDVSTLAAGTYLLLAKIGARNIVKRFTKRTVF
jgi:hypothetical protein